MICAANGLPCFKDLIAVLFECFSIISLGYLSCRFKLVSSQAKDLNSYLTNFALPMIIFLNIAQMEFRTINLSFLLCVLAAKLLVFLTVTLLTLTISYPTNFGYAGSLSILATQSNDFALGYPLIKLLYGESKPEMLNYLSLMAPIQLLILNPLGIAMLEFQKSKNHKKLKDNNYNSKHSRANKDSIGDCNNNNNNNNNNDSDNNNNDNNNNSPGKCPTRGRPCCQPNEQQQLATGGSELYSSNSHSNESTTKIGSPTRLLQVTDLLQTSLISQQQSKQSTPDSQSYSPSQLTDSCSIMSVPKSPTTDMPKSKSRKISTEDNEKCLKFRNKNTKSLVLAIPAAAAAEELHSNNPQPLSSGRVVKTLRRSSSAEPNLPTHHESVSPQQTQILDSSRQYTNVLLDDRMSLACAAQIQNHITSQVGDHHAKHRRQSSHSARSAAAATGRKCQLDLSFFKALATNPLILASIVALLVNLIHGPELPKYITRVSNTIAASFAAPALFVVGLSMYGKFELLLRNPRDLLLSSVMVLTKGLLLPSLVRTIVLLVVPSFTPSEEVPYLVDFAFLYGLLPTAPTACIIAKQYGVLQNVVSISMLLSTIMAGPLTLASSVIISPTSVISVNDIENVITQTMQTSAVLTLFLAPFTLYTFLKTRTFGLITCKNLLRSLRNNSTTSNNIKRLLQANPVRIFVLLLAMSQIMIGIGGFLWYFIDTTELNDNSQRHTMSHFDLKIQEDGLGLHNVIDPLDEPLNESSNITTPTTLQTELAATQPPATAPAAIATTTSEPQIFRQLHTGSLLSPRRSWLADHHMELGYKTLSSLRYVFSAGGLMMAQFCILSLVLVIAATKLRDRATGRQVSEVLLKACVSVLICLVVWLLYDSEQLVHLPVEASLPSSVQSLSVRLIYNITILAISLPIYALLIRSDNRNREAKKRLNLNLNLNSNDMNENGRRTSPEQELEVNTFVKRRFVTSSASLSSDASSAATSNTNLDSTLSSGQCAAVSIDGGCSTTINQTQSVPTAATATDSLSVILDTKLHDAATNLRPASPCPVETPVQRPTYLSSSLSSSPTSTNDELHQQQQTCNQTNSVTVNINNNNSNNNSEDLEKSCDNEQHHTNHSNHELNEHEFNEYSVLIVFMMINSTLNLFSVAQKMLHEEPVGTFRQIEIIGIAFEFGQGLLTFLVYGTKGLFDWLPCNNMANNFRRDTRSS